MRVLGALCVFLVVAGAAAAATVAVTTTRTGDDDAPFAFEPPNVAVSVGDTVRWVNGDGVFHTTTNRAVDGGKNGDAWSGTLGTENATFEHVFTAAGAFPYFCQPHATFMEGAVTVRADAVTSEPDGGKNTPGVTVPVLVALLGAVAFRRRR